MSKITRFLAKPLLAIALIGSVAGVAHAQGDDIIKNELKITAAQEATWKQFTETYALPFQPSQVITGEQFNAMKTPDRVAFLKKLHSEQNSFLFNRFDASVALYNALDENQKKTFDNITAERPAQQQAPAASKARSKK